MCEANAYVINENGQEELFLERVDTVTPDGDGLILCSIFGERKFIKAAIKEMALVSHRIVLKRL